VSTDIHEDPNYEGLVHSVRSQACIAFVGSGLSRQFYLPWEKLIPELCIACGVENIPEVTPETDAVLLMSLADEAKSRNPETYNSFLSNEFGKAVVGTRRAYDLLMRLKFKSYVTPNFDPLLAFESRKPEFRCGGTYEFPSLPVHRIERRGVFYIHGYVDPGRAVEDNQLILGERDFSMAYDKDHSILPGFLQQLFIFHPVFFIGCSLREPTLKPVFALCRQLRKEIEGKYSETAPPRYILLPMRYQADPESGITHRNAKAESDEDARFQELDIKVVRYDPKDKYHSAIEDILDEWNALAPVERRSGFAGGDLR
jgi:hypothetical protein